MYYPTESPQRTPLLAIPAVFCRNQCVNIQEAVTAFFRQGHPLHLLTRQVRFVCESPSHARACPNNVVCAFTEDDFVRIYVAVCSERTPRPNLDVEVRQWARRTIVQDPAAVGRIMDMFPEIEPAVAAALQVKGPQHVRPTLYEYAVQLVYRLVCSRHIDLSLVSATWLQKARSTFNRPRLTADTVAAFGAFGTWVQYLDNTSRFREVPAALRSRVTVCIAFLCDPRFTTLPVLPYELGSIILAHLFMVA